MEVRPWIAGSDSDFDHVRDGELSDDALPYHVRVHLPTDNNQNRGCSKQRTEIKPQPVDA